MDYIRIEQDFRNADVTVFDAFAAAAARYPDAIALGYFGRRIGFRELTARIEAAARGLLEAGVKPGDAVTFMLPNCPQAVAVYYAISRIGAVANMIHTLSAVEEITFYLQRARSGFLITLDSFCEKARTASDKTGRQVTVIYTSVAEDMPLPLKIGYTLKNAKEAPQKTAAACGVSLRSLIKRGAGRALPDVMYDPDRTSAIFYSGGSTGRPKGICLTDRNINALAIQVADAAGHRICPGLKFLSAMPLFHGFGLGVGIHTFICNGAQCVLVPQFTLDAYCRTLLKEKTNMLAIVPTMLEAILQSDAFDGRDLSFLQGIFCGADAASPDLQRRMNAFLKEHGCAEVVREGYGQTECVTACILNPRENVRIGSIGLPLGETRVRIVTPGTFTDLPVGQNGEMILNGPSVMKGYLDEPEETAQTLRRDADGSVWLFTGDLCRLDADGFVYFVQRIKRMIITGGYNVYPTQVEQVIGACPSVEKCCVVGVKDPLMGQKVTACAVLREGRDPVRAQAEILNACRERLAAYAVPVRIVLRDALPLTRMGKIDCMQIEREMNEDYGKGNL